MTYQNRYECDDCGFTGNEDEFPEARKLSMRLTPGGAYTDREGPECETLAFPVKTTEDEANLKLAAAAPAMLKALQAWISLAERSSMDGIDLEVGMTEAAIAKAIDIGAEKEDSDGEEGHCTECGVTYADIVAEVGDVYPEARDGEDFFCVECQWEEEHDTNDENCKCHPRQAQATEEVTT